MSEDDKLRYFLRRVTANLHETRQRLADLESAAGEPIAIVGMGCRFPGGVTSPETFWDLIAGGVDAISEFPSDRGWDLESSQVAAGGFIQGATEFDPGFFGISPREAVAMDPQQRLLLTVAWEALERAGIDPTSLRGSATGVFAGASHSGYGWGSGDLEGHLVTGTSASILSGRIAYTLGLEGPAVTVDTACSSALVCLHLASRALRAGECSMALVGGVFVASTPVMFTDFSAQLGLAPDGRCKAFGDGANGMGVAEGSGMIVLERLSDARKNGHHVLAVVRGSAMNQDGASNGLTAPNGPSQQRVIRAALADAKLSPADIDAVEAHGTGTSLGDPIEAHALLATYGQDRPEDRPLLLGSVKANIGHAQQAAGMAGLMKIVMALQNNLLPRTLHADQPSSHIDWDSGRVRLLTEEQPWEPGERPRRMGLSGFGMSGTNVHVILSDPPPPEAEEPPAEGDPEEVAEEEVPPLAVLSEAPPVWMLSGRTAAGMSEQAERLAWLATQKPELRPVDIAWSLARTRSRFEYRAVVRADDRDGLIAGLGDLAEGKRNPGVASGIVTSTGRTVFVFPGQGAQWAGMGDELRRVSPVFAARLAECAAALAPHVDWNLEDVLAGREGAPGIEQAAVVQPALWAVMVSLAAVWEAAGIVPDAVVGHSQGEIAAACVAGILSLEDAAHVIAARSRALSGLAVEAGMLSVVMPVAAVEELLVSFDPLSVAAVNGPATTVVSGDLAALDKFERVLSKRRVLRWRIPQTDFVAHSARVEPLAEPLRRELAGIAPQAGRVPMFSTVTGERIDGTTMDAGYWYSNVRERVRFQDAVVAAGQSGGRTFVEVSPQPVLIGPITETFEDLGVPTSPVITGTLERDNPGAARFLGALAHLHVHGGRVDWTRVLPEGSIVDLPTYAFQTERYWLEPTLTKVARPEAARTDTASWRYSTEWAPVAAPLDASKLSGTWLLVTGDASPAERCSRMLSDHGASVVTIPAAGLDREALAAAVAVPGVTGVLSLLALDETPRPDFGDVAVGVADTLTLIQALGDAGIDAPLWVLSSGAVDAVEGDELSSPVQVQARALGRVASLEHRDRWGGLIDLPLPEWDSALESRLAAVLSGVTGEIETAIRTEGIFGRRLVPAAVEHEFEWTPGGTVLITGGTGAIGGHVARWATGRNAQRVALVSRSGPAAVDAGLIADLVAAGTAVDVVSADVSRRAELEALLARIAATGPAVSSVMHTAGVVDNGTLDRLDVVRLSTVLAAKATSAALLDELTDDLDAFVLFSSAAATFGGGGQGNYAAANAYLDALAQNRRHRGLPGTSLAWGPWAGGGVAASSEKTRQRLARNSWEVLMDPALCVKALGEALDGDDTALTVMDVDWSRMSGVPGMSDLHTVPLVRDLPQVRALAPEIVVESSGVQAEGALALQLLQLSRTEQERILTDLIRSEVAAVLNYPSLSSVDGARAFSDLGFDSLTAVELRNQLSSATGLRLPASLLFDYPTPLVLATHLRTSLVGSSGAASVEPVVGAASAVDLEPIAIVGMGGRYPGGIDGPESFWEMLSSGSEGYSPVPVNRGWDTANLFDPDPDHPGTAYVQAGGFVQEAGQFDPGFFGISPREALAMDPQQRLLLETSWEALERAGIDPRSLRGSATGVFAGGYSSGYAMGIQTSPEGTAGLEGHMVTGNAGSVISGRISYLLGLEGPSLTIDTACSSSLVAMHLAVTALRSGECRLALAGGVTVMATPAELIGFSKQRGLAQDGRSKSFSAAADGMGMAEGAGLIVLERLSDAQRNGHPVLAVIRGTAVNQDGASNGLTAPNGPSQQRVIRAALANAGLTTADIDAVEAHGTGTVLGDPIEAQALAATYGVDRPQERPLYLGSVKSNFGHSQAAAGVAGVIKMVLALQHEQLPQSLHSGERSPHIEWDGSGLHLLTEAVDWPSRLASAGDARRAGISAFGISGTNAHVVIEEAPVAGGAENLEDVSGTSGGGVSAVGGGVLGAADRPADGSGSVSPSAGSGPRMPALVTELLAWPISARTSAALDAQAGKLAAFLRARPGSGPASVARSLTSTRSQFEHRAVLLGTDTDTLLSHLALLEGAISGVVPASAPRVGFVFAGQGAQRAGMGRELHAASPVFADVFDRVCALLEPEVGLPIREVILSEEEDPRADRTGYAQAGLFAVEVSLVAMLAAAGIVPAAVAGHSVGEIAAAYVAGVLNLQDACRLVGTRARLMEALPEGGAMAAIAVSEAEILAELPEGVSVAAVNGPASVVVSGEQAAVEGLVELWRERGKRVRRLRVSHAFHSARMDAVLDELGAVASGMAHSAPTITWVGALTGQVVTSPAPGYWPAQARQAVRFADAVSTTAAQDISVIIEIGPDATLSGMGPAVLDSAEFVPLLRPQVPAAESVLTALAWAHVRGVEVDWAAVTPAAPIVPLPTYAFQHEYFWPGGPQRLRPLAESDSGEWLYRTSWAGVSPKPVSGENWLLVTGAAGRTLAADLARVAEAAGTTVTLVEVGADKTDRAALAERIRVSLGETVRLAGPGELDEAAGAERGAREAGASVAGPDRIVSLLALDQDRVTGTESVSMGLAGTLGLLQGLGDIGRDARLWVVTRGAVAVSAADRLTSPVQAQVWGMGQVAALEHPDRWGGLIDLPAQWDEGTASRLVASLAVDEDQLAIRPQGVLARRLIRATDVTSGESRWTGRGTALVTGGTGAIGARVARWLAEHGTPDIVLTSRSGALANGAARLAAELAEAGSTAVVLQADVSRRDDVTGLLASVINLKAVVHTAGVVDDGVLDRLDVDRFETVLAAKARGAQLLDELTADLDAFVLFSSSAATFGGGGQGNYAAANAYLDALVQNRRDRGLPGASLAWGPWAGGGMAQADDAVRQRLERGVLRALAPDKALNVLGHALSGAATGVLTVMDVDWAKAGATAGLAQMPLVRDLPEVLRATPEPVSVNALTQQLTGVNSAAQMQLLTELVRAEAAAVLGHAGAGAVDAERPFSDIGFDSLTAVELRNRLTALTGLTLPATLVFDYPTPAVLASFLRSELLGDAAAVAAPGRAVVDDDPIAIVGMACRFPGGVESPEQFWQLLVDGTDAVTGFPVDRGWDLDTLFDADPSRPGSSITRAGGFVHDAGDFDPAFFGINPREALAMDPQQRILLQMSWEAIERAGIDPRTLRGSETGVFAGSGFNGYGVGAQDSGLEGYQLTGMAASVISGRVSYALGLEGPAVTVDTACSSSMVALHLAAQALRAQECTLALAGGVTVMAVPTGFSEFSRQQGLASDGRCKAFSASADGTGWAEGAGILVLERLSDAQRSGHQVLAVVAGSAINQDGASNGLTAPNGPSQQRVIRSALAAAGLGVADVDVVEAHGTGTTLGDPIEAQALLATYGRERRNGQPLWLGSVKSNIGHTQSAAGVAGIMKMVLALQHGMLPRTLHVERPTDQVDWSAGAVQLLTEAQPWPAGERLRRAGVSSFGMSGTNAHVVLEEAPVLADVPDGPKAPVLDSELAWLVSARTPEALRRQAGRLTDRVDMLEPGDVAWSLATSRSMFEHRAVVVGCDRDELVAGLAALAEGASDASVIAAAAGPSNPAVFVFPGQGSQWAGMGRALAGSSPVFAARLAECGAALAPYVDWNLDEALDGPLDQVDVVQPVLWAVMVSLARVWEAAGVRPAAVVGHSQGEIAAAVVAGILSLEDGARVVALRSQALRALSGHGGMLSIAEPVEVITDRIEPWAGRVAVAAINGPEATVISGDLDALTEIAQKCEQAGVRRRLLPVDYASHGPQVDQLREEILAALAGITPRAGTVPLTSSLTGGLLAGEDAGPEYWYASLRATVEFSQAIQSLYASGRNVFIEVSPHPVLVNAISATVEQLIDDDVEFVEPVVSGTLRRDEGTAERFLRSLAEVHVRGVRVDWASVLTPARTIALPTYPFARERFWVEGRLAPRRSDSVVVDPTADWRYRVTWAPIAAARSGGLEGRWVVVSGAAGAEAADVLENGLRGGGAEVVRARMPLPVDSRLLVTKEEAASAEASGAADEVGEAEVVGSRVLGGSAVGMDRFALAELVRESLGGEPVAGVISLLALEEAGLAPGLTDGLVGTVGLVQALGDLGLKAPLWVLTQGAVAAGADQAPRRPAQAPVWGMGRVAALEHPDRWGGLVDLPPDFGDAAAGRLVAVLTGSEDQVAIRGAGVLGRRLARAAGPSTKSIKNTWAPRGTVLVTGGTGAIGGRLAEMAAERGAQRVVLTSRSGAAAAGIAQRAARLANSGVMVDVVAADVAQRAQVAGLVGWIGAGLSSVFHAAGVGGGDPISELTTEALAAATAAKAAGGAHLDELTEDLLTEDLDAFVTFSSGAAVWGSAHLTGYAAANTALDALVESRRARGLAGTSVAWGLWGGGGMAEGSSGEFLQRMGLREMDPDAGIAVLAGALDHGDVTLTVADIDWERFASVFSVHRPSPLITGVLEARAALSPGATDGPKAQEPGNPLAARLAGPTKAEQLRMLTELVRTEAAIVLGHSSTDALPAGKAFQELGFDSLTAVDLRNRLSSATGLTLPATLVFDYPTASALASFLRTRLVGDDSTTQTGPVRASSNEPIAIVGLGLRFPGGADSPDAFWKLLSEGADAVGDLPSDRGWDLDAIVDATGRLPQGGYLYDAGEFDPGFFGISPREALTMDPQQRLLLESSWEALERAGIDPEGLRGSSTGVFVGASWSGYGLDPHGGGDQGHLLTGTSSSVLSGRMSYVLGLEGPAVSVDTACSSSLVAMHLAGQALRSGECDLALAGGAYVAATPIMFTSFTTQLGQAPDGRCKAFGAGADGMGMAEGAGILVLERLSDAQRNGHHVLAVIRGSAVNQDGASNGLTAPNGPSQQRVIRAALASAGLTAADVDVVEAHGTGTSLGDPIEAGALMATYGAERGEGEALWLGSVKSNIGHTQAASGAAAVIKMVLALQHQELPRTLHVEEPSPQIDWNAGDVRLLSEPVAWTPGGRVRRAGVSGFGMSGTNAHLIIEEAPVGSSVPVEEDLPVLAEPVPVWALSGRTAAALSDQAVRLRSWIGDSTNRDDVAWSLATGRTAFEHRAVVLGDDLVAGLTALSEKSSSIISGVADGRPRVGFLFAGQGAQRGGMGRELYAASPVFAQAFDEAMAGLEAEIGPELRDLVLGAPDDPRADQTVFAQAGLFAVEVGLLAVLKAAGVTPDVVAGHSVGEIAAAYAAGVLSLADAAALVAARGRLMQALPAGGAMAALEASEAEVEATLFGGVSIAAVNGPSSVVVSGDAEAVDALVELWRAQDRRVRRLRVSHAFHSARMDPMLGELSTVASGLEHSVPALTWVGALTGEVVTAPAAGYWPAQARQAVRFTDTVQAMRDAGVTVFVEIGPDGTLSGMGASVLDDALFVPTRRENQSVADGLLSALARVYTKGVEVDWRRVLPAGRTIDLPTYAFQHERFWVEATAAPESDREFWAAVEEGDAQALGLDDAAQLDAIRPLLTSWRRRRVDKSATDGWRYRIAWEPVAGLNASAERPLAGSWLLVSGPRESGSAYEQRIGAVEQALSEGGAEVFGVTVTSEDNRQTMAGKVADALGGAPAGVLWLPPNDLLPTVRLVQALGDASVAAPLWMLTQGAVVDQLPDPAQAAVWGFGRVVALEHPERWGGLIDLPADAVPTQLCAVLAQSVEDQVALRGEDVLARRLVHAGPVRKSDEQWTPAGPVLITGGSGSLGSRVARWVAGRGAESIVLTSRSGALASGLASVAADLALSGSGVSVLSADIGERDHVAGLLGWVADHDAPVDSVFHVAGSPEAAAVEAVDADGLSRVTSAKADGALWLDQLTASLCLSAFVVFSSISATWGSGHQPGYAAANAFLDALVENRRGRGLTGTSLAWGPWSGGGMGALGEAETAFRSRGLRYLDGDRALGVLGSALDAGESSLTVADVDWERFAGVFTLRRPSALLNGLPEVRAALAETDDVAVDGNDLAARLEGRPRAEQDRILTTLVRTEAAAVLGHPSIEPVGASRAFKDLGFDSLTAVELRNRVVAATGQRLAATVVFDYPTSADLAAHVRGLVLPEEPAVPVLAELDALEARLAALAGQGSLQAEVTVRLQTLLSGWIGASATSDASEPAAQRLESADAEAVFDFIDRELGVAPLDGHLDPQ